MSEPHSAESLLLPLCIVFAAACTKQYCKSYEHSLWSKILGPKRLTDDLNIQLSGDSPTDHHICAGLESNERRGLIYATSTHLLRFC